VVVALGNVNPAKLLARVQRVDLNSNGLVEDFSAADELVQLLQPLHVQHSDCQVRVTEVKSMGYTLKSMIRLSKIDKSQPLLGPQVFLAPMVHNNGVERLRNILEYTQDLEDTCLDKWRTQERVAEFLRLLIRQNEEENKLLRSFQNHISKMVMNESFAKLLCRLPAAACIDSSEHSLDLKKHVMNLTNNLRLLFPDVHLK